MGVMSLYDLIQGESVVLNCTASYWSVVFTILYICFTACLV